jgi:hypothetical protein
MAKLLDASKKIEDASTKLDAEEKKEEAARYLIESRKSLKRALESEYPAEKRKKIDGTKETKELVSLLQSILNYCRFSY